MKKLVGIIFAFLFFFLCIVAALMAKENATGVQSLSFLLAAATWKISPSRNTSGLSAPHLLSRLTPVETDDGETHPMENNRTQVDSEPEASFFDHRSVKNR
jgi:phosphotransferase system  glucose/maltose/N-acetylglucosamine-specific IIC component